MLRCPNEQACEMSNTLESSCAPGYQGFLCTQCSPGYWQSQLTYNCYECDRDGFDGKLKYGLVAGGVIILVIWLGMAYIRTVSSRLNHETVPLVRIFINMVHMVAILNGLPFLSDSNPSDIRSRITEGLDYDTSRVLPFTTLADSACLGDEAYQSQTEQFEREVIGLTGLPVALMLISGCVLAPLEMFLREQGKARHWCRNSMSYFSVMMFLAMPSIMIGLLQAITCYDTVESGNTISSHIKYHPEMQCRDLTEMYNLIALVGLCFWVGVVPVIHLISASVCWTKLLNKGGQDRQDYHSQKQVVDVKHYFGFESVGIKNGITN